MMATEVVSPRTTPTGPNRIAPAIAGTHMMALPATSRAMSSPMLLSVMRLLLFLHFRFPSQKRNQHMLDHVFGCLGVALQMCSHPPERQEQKRPVQQIGRA